MRGVPPPFKNSSIPPAAAEPGDGDEEENSFRKLWKASVTKASTGA